MEDLLGFCFLTKNSKKIFIGLKGCSKVFKRTFIQNLEQWDKSIPLTILGPTGSGKTASVLKFLRENALSEVLLVSLDSVAAYKELNIGSSKPLGSDREDFDWLGLDLVSIDSKMKVSTMRDMISADLLEAQKNKRPLVFVGGTHFYERFIIEGAAPGEASDPDFQSELLKRGRESVLEELLAIDTRWSQFLHPNDEYRIFRYADLVLRQGHSYEELKGETSKNSMFKEVQTLVLECGVSALRQRLEKRIQEMFHQGWLEECQDLLKRFPLESPGFQSIGYREIVDHLSSAKIMEGTALEELKESIFIRHRQLAKQQRTWLKKLSG
jgi:tRNA dimethylallyltransferase